MADEPDHDDPVHRRSAAADRDEPSDAPSRDSAVHAARPHGMARTICICVDDFGLHAGVNEAAARLAALNRVHALGCLVGGEGWSVAWNAVLRRLDTGGIDIGLHLDLTESPLLAGSRRRLPWLIGCGLLRCLDAAAIRAEIRAQLDTFEQVLGHAPAFVDGHQHVHQLPVVRHELLDELVGRYRGKLPWLRSTRSATAAGQPMFKARVIEALGSRALHSVARRMGFVQNKRLLGVYDFEGGPERFARLLAAWMQSAREGDLLMCHAGLGLHAGDPLAAARQAEYEVLAGAEFPAVLRDAGLALRPMSRILEHGTVSA
jgi:chitin disaccharide deacetylase